PRRYGALGRAARIEPARIIERLLQRCPIALAVAQPYHWGTLGEARSYQLYESSRQILGNMSLGALPHAPRQWQGAPFIQPMEHQCHPATAHDTAIHHQHERLKGARRQEELRIR